MSKKNYGIPYMGSKNRIAVKLIDFLPSSKVLVDLFGGGGAVSDCASQTNKWERIIYNEIALMPYKGFQMALNGEFQGENRWISREEFFKLKDIDPYVCFCFSFGNNLKDYMYSAKIEPYKKAIHYAVLYNDYSLMQEWMPETVNEVKAAIQDIPTSNTKQRRIKLQNTITQTIKDLNNPELLNIPIYGSIKKKQNRLQSLQSLERLERLERLQSLERLESLARQYHPIELYNKDYQDVELPKPSECVIYCDIPYEKTGTYINIDFDYERFYKWVETKVSEGYEIYVSSYSLPEDKFIEVWSTETIQSLSPTKSSKTIEKVFKWKK